MFECDCSIDCDETVEVCVETFPKARVEHLCCECGNTIKPGTKYVREFTVFDGVANTHKTCLPCHRIRSAYCPHGFMWGGLAEHIKSCLGYDYREDPAEWDQEEVDSEDEDHRKRTLEELEKRRKAS